MRLATAPRIADDDPDACGALIVDAHVPAESARPPASPSTDAAELRLLLMLLPPPPPAVKADGAETANGRSTGACGRGRVDQWSRRRMNETGPDVRRSTDLNLTDGCALSDDLSFYVAASSDTLTSAGHFIIKATLEKAEMLSRIL